MDKFTTSEKHFILFIAGARVTKCEEIVPYLSHPSEWGLQWENATEVADRPFKIPHKLSFSGNLFGKDTSGSIQLEGHAPVNLMKRQFQNANKGKQKDGKPRDLLDWTEMRIQTERHLNTKEKNDNDRDDHEKYILSTKGGIRALVEAICIKLKSETQFMKEQPYKLKDAVQGVLDRVTHTTGSSIPSAIKVSSCAMTEKFVGCKLFVICVLSGFDSML